MNTFGSNFRYMFNYIESSIANINTQFIGRKIDGEKLILAKDRLSISTESINEKLMSYFFDSFLEESFFKFKPVASDLNLNPVYKLVKMIFDQQMDFLNASQELAKLLYDKSDHPNIKSGDLICALIDDVLIQDELLQCICIFKSENKQELLKIKYGQDEFSMDTVEGFSTQKLDKACIILNTESESGYQILAIDKSNPGKEAQFWMESFLNIEPVSNNYRNTTHYIQATKSFIEDRVKPLYDVDKADEALILNRSKEYFKNEDTFNQKSYAKRVFNDEQLIAEFDTFQTDFQSERNIKLNDDFNISQSAVKRNSRIFKSVLKLDKNFHVYIHGNRQMIERGTDPDGRKYYKLYYNEEN